MDLLIQTISLDKFKAEPNLAYLLSEYAQESKIDGMPEVDPDWPAYAQLEAAGVLTVIGAYVGSELAGFILLSCMQHPHYKKRLGSTMCFFVTMAHRKTGAALRMLHMAEDIATQKGCVGLLSGAPGGGVLERVLPHIGFSQTTSIWFRELK
jgi:hypothetical protein